MHRSLVLSALVPWLLPVTAPAQQDPDYAVSNNYRVVSGATHPVTGRRYPVPDLEPPGYSAAPGIAAGTRSWAYTPPLRAQAASQGTVEYTVTGFTQAIFAGAANNNSPVTNHYQFATGIGPARATSTPPLMEHDPAAADVLYVASGSVAIPPNTTIYEHSFKLTTPVPIAAGTPMLLFVEFKGGEWRDDTNGGQMHGNDYYGGLGPNSLTFHGHTVGSRPNRTVTLSRNRFHRVKIGLLIQEPVLAATGDHGNFYPVPRLSNERYRGLSACWADYQFNPNSTFFFDVSAGSAYGVGGAAVPLLNVSKTNFPGSLPIPGLGNLLLSIADPNFAAFAGLVMPLDQNGDYTGEQTPLVVGALGPGASGFIVKAQAIVFTVSGNYKLTTASGIYIR